MNWKGISKEVEFKAQRAVLHGTLNIPESAPGAIIFVHGSGSSRFSPRNLSVAETLNDAGFATFLFDLLTADEEVLDQQTAELRFNIPLLCDRLIAATAWLIQQEELRQSRVGYFGASTGAAAALMAAAELPRTIQAIVSRGGRPDLAKEALPKVNAATLFIVGGKDTTVIELNTAAFQHLTTIKELRIIPGASHLFEEPGTLLDVSKLALHWFDEYLSPPKKTIQTTAS